MKIFIRQLEKKFTKENKPYMSAETDQGKMSIFDTVVIEEIEKAGIPNEFELKIEERGAFKNVVGITPRGLLDATKEIETVKMGGDPSRKIFAGMAISYSKDLVVAGKVGVDKLKETALEIMKIYEEINK